MKRLSIFSLGCLLYIYTTNISKIDGECIVSERRVICEKLNASVISNFQNEDINALEIRNSTIQNIKQNSFQKYSKLTDLVLERVEVKYVHKEFLKNTNLSNISIKNSSLDKFPHYIWPSTMESLTITDMNLMKFELTQPLRNFVKLELKGVNLQKFPTLNESYPLLTLAFDNNPSLEVTAEDLIPFCRLQALYVNYLYTKLSETERKNNCNCLRLMQWMSKRQIKNNLNDNLCQAAKNTSSAPPYRPPTAPPITKPLGDIAMYLVVLLLAMTFTIYVLKILSDFHKRSKEMSNERRETSYAEDRTTNKENFSEANTSHEEN